MSRLLSLLLVSTALVVVAANHPATPPWSSLDSMLESHEGACDFAIDNDLDNDSDCESHTVVGHQGLLPPDPLLVSVVSTHHHHHHAHSYGVQRFDGERSSGSVASIEAPSTPSCDARSSLPVTIHAVNRPRRL